MSSQFTNGYSSKQNKQDRVSSDGAKSANLLSVFSNKLMETFLAEVIHLLETARPTANTVVKTIPKGKKEWHSWSGTHQNTRTRTRMAQYLFVELSGVTTTHNL